MVPVNTARLKKIKPILQLSTAVALAGLLLTLVLSTILTPVYAAGITVSKTTSANPVKAGVPYTYTINVRNETGYDILASIHDRLPTGLTVLDRGGGGISGGEISWLNYPVVDQHSITVTFRVVVTQVGTVVNDYYYATSSATSYFGNPVNTNIIPNNPAKVSIQATPNPATVGGSANLTFSVTDAYGNHVADDTVLTIAFDRGTIGGQTGSITTTTSGEQALRTLLIGNTEVGTAHITATTTGGVQGTASLVINPGPPNSLTVSSSVSSISTVGGQTAAITAAAIDIYGNAVANTTPITFTTNLGKLDGNGSVKVVYPTGGNAVVSLSGTTAGTATVTAQTGSLTDSVQVYLSPGPPATMNMTANPAQIPADGVSTATVTLDIFDTNGNRVDTAVPFILTTSLGTWPGGGTTYNGSAAHGLAQIPLTSITQTGTANISAQISGLPPVNRTVNFVPGAPVTIDLTFNPPAVVANGASSTIVSATARDAFNNVCTGNTLTFTLITADGTWSNNTKSISGSTTSGIFQKSLKSSTNLGTVPVTVTVTAMPTPTVRTVEFIAGPPHHVDVHVDPSQSVSVTAGDPVTLTFTVRDSVNHIIPNVPITMTASYGQVTPAVTNTNSAGQITATLVATHATLLGDKVDLAFISYNGALDDDEASYTIQIVPDSPANAVVTVVSTQIIADGTSNSSITARITDQYNNPVAGYTPSFTITPAIAGTVTNGSPAWTNSDGIATGKVTAKTVLTSAIVSVIDPSLTHIQSALVTFIPGPPYVATVDVQQTPPYVVCADLACNNSNMITMVITTTDVVGHLLANQNVIVTSSLGTLGGSNCGLTNSGGGTTCTLYSTRTGTATISVDNSHPNPAIQATGDPIYFNPGPFDHVTIAQKYSYTNPRLLQSGTPFTFTATAHDIHSNLRTTDVITVWQTISYGGTGTINGGNNQGVFVGQKVGKVLVKASYGGKEDISFVQVTPGPAVQANITATPLTLLADGSPSSLTINVKDAFGNAVGSGFTPIFGPTIGWYENTTTTDSSGRSASTLRSYTAGTANISITNLLTVTGNTAVTFTAGAPTNVLIKAQTSTGAKKTVSLPANGTTSTDLYAFIADSHGNPLGAGWQLKVAATSGALSGCDTNTNSSGLVHCTLTPPLVAGTEIFNVSYYTGQYWMPLTKDSNSDTVKYVVGPLATVEITPGTTSGDYPVIAGLPVTFKAQGYDSQHAPLPVSALTYDWFVSLPCFDPGCPYGEATPLTGTQTIFTGQTAGGGITLNIVANDGSGDKVDSQAVVVIAAPPNTADIAASPASVTANGASVITYTLTNLTDQFGNDSPEGTPITMTVHTVPLAKIKSGVISGGQVRLPITATTLAGTYPISAASPAGNIALSGATSAIFNPGPPVKAQILAATPANLVADGTSTSQLVIQLRDFYNNTAAPGLAPTLAISPTNLGTFTGATTTDSRGILTATLKAGLGLGQAHITINGTITPTGVMVSLVPGRPVSATVMVTPSTTIVVGSRNTTATFAVYDNWGHLVADGEPITPTLTLGGGAFSGIRQTLRGVVTQTIVAGTNDMTDTLGAAGLAVTGNTALTFIPGPPTLALVKANPTELDVQEFTNLTITVTDEFGNVTPSAVITVTSILTGTLDGVGPTITRATQTGTGKITASLVSSNAGTETLRLTGPAGQLNLDPASDIVTFYPDNPTHVQVTPAGSITLTADVVQKLSAASLDQYNNRVDPWVDIYYTWASSARLPRDPGFGTISYNDFKLSTIDFLPQTVGRNHITATARISSTQQVIGSASMTVTVVAGAPAKATVSVNPNNVLADGISTYVVTVTNVTDKYGNAIDRTPLTVTVQAPGRYVVSSGVTSNGTLALVMTSTIKAGVHPIVVTGNNGPLTLSGDTVVTFRAGEPTAAYVSASKTVLPADGSSSSTLIISIEDGNGNLIGSGVPITVTTNMVGVTIVGTDPTVNGKITRLLIAPQSLGQAKIKVMAPNIELPVGGDAYITFTPGAPYQASITASSPKIIGNGISQSNLIITIKDSIGHTVDTSKWAELSVSRGTIVPTGTMASNGSFTAVFNSDKSVGPVDIDVIYDGVGPLLTVGDTLEQIPGPAMSATVSASPTSLKIGTSDQSSLVFSLYDASGNPVANGTVVTATTTSSVGSLVPATATTVAGKVTRVLTPGLNVGTVGLAVKANPSGLSGNLPLTWLGSPVTVLPGNLATLEISPANPGNLNAGTVITFTAKGYDAGGYPISGLDVNWVKMLASGGDGILTKTGSVTATFKATKTGSLGLWASQGAIYSYKTLTVVPGAAATALVHADPLTITVGGDTSDLTITVRDAYNNLVANGLNLSVVATRGGAVQCDGPTSNGVLNCTVQAGSFYGLADIYVAGFMAGGDKVYFAAQASVTPLPATLVADGVSKSSLAVRVVDLSGNEVPDGTSAAVTATKGTVSGCDTTVNSILHCTFTASRTVGLADFFVNGLQATGHLTLTSGPAALARIAANPTYMMANDTSTSTLTITVEDNYGHVITNAGSLNVSSSLGTISGVEPTVNGVTHRMLTSQYLSKTEKAVIAVAGLTAVGDKEISLAAPAINDSGFEDGTFGDWVAGQWVNWREDGSTLAYTATVLSSDTVGGITVTPPNGNKMLRLGATTPDNTDHAQSEAWIRQPLYIPATGIMQIVVSYRILSYDVMTGTGIIPASLPAPAEYAYDPFEVYVDGQMLYHDGFNYETWADWYGAYPGPASPQDTGWYQSKPLTLLNTSTGEHLENAGQMAMLEFRVANNRNPSNEIYAETDNTWVYIDDISVRYISEADVTYNVFLPIIIR